VLHIAGTSTTPSCASIEPPTRSSPIPADAKRGIDGVRRFGLGHDVPLLTTPEWPGGRAEGLEMLAAAGQIQEASGGFIDTAGDLIFFFTLHRFRVRDQ